MQFLRKDAGSARRAEGRALKSVRVDRDQIRQDEGLADELGQQAGDVALAWLLSQPAVTAPVIGLRTQERLHAALRALDVELDEPTLIRLHEFVPGCRTVLEDCGW
jgi:aryl-alcohol dehydrogenase-like predicted oxidoreductase